MLSEYERMMLKLKVVELAQLQTMLAIQADNSKDENAITIAETSNEILDSATNDVEKLLIK